MPIHNSCGLCSILLKDITVKSGDDILIENINLTFHCGELTALMGKNGAGKTTLLKAILGERPYTGEITFLRHDDSHAKKPIIGYVPQQLNFDRSTPLSVLDFMAASREKRPVWLGHKKEVRQSCQKRLEELNCAHVIDRVLGELSGGELQRVLLAMAIDPLPDLLILDEPVSGVDAAGLDLFYRMVTNLRDHYHMAIILVSHDLNLIRKYADKAVLIERTVKEEGDVSQVYATKAFREAFGYFEEGETAK